MPNRRLLELRLCAKSCARVGHYKRSSQARQRLHKIKRRMGKSEQELIQDVDTHWNTERAFFTAELPSSDGVNNLSAREWKLAEGAVKILGPINEATREFSGQDYPTIFLVIPLIDGFKSMLVICVQSRLDSGEEIIFVRNLLKAVCKYLGAMLLDPRFKSLVLKNPEKRKHANISETLFSKDSGNGIQISGGNGI
ncbi:hypothetical protein PR048_021114 [Dryococelus australis]|uniref:Uncharacterized protein n=1 Tax=Dryococelus australis TaxID=614101 RepID=A0ABQ9GXC4_9NEOP|nr:hypothetical protein PR048_021114 [Dryococelus australis]